MKITIIEHIEHGINVWYAVCDAPQELHAQGIIGQLTDSGPFAEGYGGSPDNALRELYVTIGRACVMNHWDTWDTNPQEPEQKS